MVVYAANAVGFYFGRGLVSFQVLDGEIRELSGQLLADVVAEGDEKAKLVKEAFIKQLSKNIGAMATVLEGKVDQIIVTGGIAYDKEVVAGLKEACEWIAPFTLYPGEDELLALAQGGLRVMNGQEEAKDYASV